MSLLKPMTEYRIRLVEDMITPGHQKYLGIDDKETKEIIGNAGNYSTSDTENHW